MGLGFFGSLFWDSGDREWEKVYVVGTSRRLGWCRRSYPVFRFHCIGLYLHLWVTMK